MNVIPKTALTAGVLLLLATGCSATPQAAAPTTVPATATASASAAAPASSAPASSAPAPAPVAKPYTNFDERLSIEPNRPVAAGSKLHVSGGTLAPGTGVKVHASQMMAPPTYNAESGMMAQNGDEVMITDTVEAVADAKGCYELDLLIPAGTPPQLFTVTMVSSDGRGDLVMGTIK